MGSNYLTVDDVEHHAAGRRSATVADGLPTALERTAKRDEFPRQRCLVQPEDEGNAGPIGGGVSEPLPGDRSPWR